MTLENYCSYLSDKLGPDYYVSQVLNTQTCRQITNKMQIRKKYTCHQYLAVADIMILKSFDYLRLITTADAHGPYY
jgi:hypothetical protein